MLLENTRKKKLENNRQYIYRVLKENIMRLNLKPGELISETELANSLNVSRTPIREAIVKLSEEKLIDVFPQRGSFVSKIDLNLVEEAVFLRELCEKKLLKLACDDENNSELLKVLQKNLAYQKIILDFDENLHKFFDLDNEFHSLIFSCYNKKNVWKSIRRLATHYDRLRLIDALQFSQAMQSYQEHKKIIEIIKNRNYSIIDEFIVGHLSKFRVVLTKYVDKYPEFFV